MVEIGSCSGQSRMKKGKDCLLRIGMRGTQSFMVVICAVC